MSNDLSHAKIYSENHAGFGNCRKKTITLSSWFLNDINEKSIQKNSRSTASATSAARGEGTVLHGRG